MEPFWYSTILLGILGAFIALFGLFNSIVFDGVSQDIKNSLKDHFTTYFIVCVVMVSVLSILAFYFIRLNPANYQTYSMVVTHISLLLSLSALSFATLSH